eukprot:351762-Chlamydomonas_euryale.AAC.4
MLLGIQPSWPHLSHRAAWYTTSEPTPLAAYCSAHSAGSPAAPPAAHVPTPRRTQPPHPAAHAPTPRRTRPSAPLPSGPGLPVPSPVNKLEPGCGGFLPGFFRFTPADCKWAAWGEGFLSLSA